MSIYLITRTDHTDHGGYDENHGFVVIAETEDQALAIICDYSSQHGDEPESVWTNAEITELNPDGEPGIVLVDYLAG